MRSKLLEEQPSLTQLADLLRKLHVSLTLINEKGLDPQSALILDECRRSVGGVVSTLASQHGGNAATGPVLAPKEKSEAPINLLIIDDDKDAHRLLRFALTTRGFAIADETNPEAALTFLTHYTPDVILLDLMMPQMTGFEFLHRIRDIPNRSKIRVMVGSSRTFDKDRVTALEAGADEFVAKPFNIDELALRLRKLVRDR